MRRLILVRHGESEGNFTRTFTLVPTVPLTERGRAQAREAAERIGGAYRPERVVSSPFTRAHDTALIITAALGLATEVEVQDIWCEQDLGELAGKPYDTVRNDPRFDPARRWTWQPPGGESLDDLRNRIAPGIEDILGGEASDTMIVSHAGTMQAIQAHLLNGWDAVVVPPNAGVLVVEFEAGAPPRLEPLWKKSPPHPG